jgi:uncharacterized protein (DUF58 family)
MPEIREGLRLGRNLGPRYRLALPRAALRGRDGVRLGVGAGSSLDFHDYRDYHPGDDLRHLDWSVYARSDREVIKRFREEVAPHLDIVLDVSRSMALEGTAKARAAATIVAACAVAAEQSHCSRALWLCGGSVRTLPGANEDPLAWPAFDFDSSDAPDTALLRTTPVWRPHGIRIFISDLLWPSDPAPLLARLAAGAAACTVVQLLAESEVSPSARGACRLEDVESGDFANLVVDASALAAYADALARHREGWAQACRAVGADFVAVTAENLVQDARLPALEACGLLEAG